MTTGQAVITQEALERALVEQSFIDFLDYVYVDVPGIGAVKFEKWPHLMAIAEIAPKVKRLAWLKARQIGATWELGAAYALWLCMYHPSQKALIMSKSEQDAADVLARSVFIYDHLPRHLQTPGRHIDKEFDFPGNGSRIEAIHSGPDTGRSKTATLVVADEADFQPYLDVNIAALMPTLGLTGQMFLLSTPDPQKIDSKFKELYRSGTLVDLATHIVPKVDGWVRVYVPWNVVPGRGPDFRKRQEEEQGLTAFQVEKEYSETEEEALAPARSAMFFDRDGLTADLADCREPSETRLGAVSIWRKPVVAGKYVAFADCAWGETMAYDCLTVMDWQTGEVVAEVHARLTDDEMAKVIVDLCTEYNKAFLGVESNGEGINVTKKCIALGYGRNMYHKGEKWDAPEDTYNSHRGWWTNESTRPVMLGEYAEAKRNRQVIERCKESMQEHFNFIRNERGRAMHASGSYDDHVMSRAGAWQMRKWAHWKIPSNSGPVFAPPAF